MLDELQDVVRRLDEFEPSITPTAGVREFATAQVEATIALAQLLDAFGQRLQEIDQKLDRNNELLHNMVRVLSSTDSDT